MHLRTSTLWVVTGAILAAAAVTYVAANHLHAESERAAELHSLRGVAHTLAIVEQGERDKLSAALDAILADDGLRRAFLRRDRAALMQEATPLFEQLRRREDVTHWYFIEPDSTCFLRVHAPEIHGDRIERLTTLLAMRSGDMGSGKELGATAFALRVVRPWRDRDGTLLGYVELAEEIDRLLLRAKRETGDDVALVVKKKFLDEKIWRSVNGRARDTWNDRPDEVVVDTTSFTEGLVDHHGDLDAIPEQGAILEERARAGRSYMRGAFPVRDAGGRRIGAAFVFHDVTELHVAFEANRRRGLFVALGAAVLLALAAGLALELLVFRRLARLRDELAGREPRVKEPQGQIALGATGDAVADLEKLVAGRELPTVACETEGAVARPPTSDTH